MNGSQEASAPHPCVTSSVHPLRRHENYILFSSTILQVYIMYTYI